MITSHDIVPGLSCVIMALLLIQIVYIFFRRREAFSTTSAYVLGALAVILVCYFWFGEVNKDKGTAQRLFFVYKSVTSALVCDVNLENIGEYANVTWHLYMFEAAVGFTVAAALNTAIQLVFAGTAGLFGRIRMLFCETDIVWGKSEIGLEYAKKNKKTIYWVGPGQDTGKKWSYFADKVTICTLPFTEGSIKTLIKGSRRVRFIVFKGDSDTISKNLGMFYNVVSKLDEKRLKSEKETNLKVRASLYLEVENNSKEQIARFATSKNTATINDSIFCFSRHDLMANLVVSEYPITKYLDDEFIDTQNAVIQNDTRINIIYLGFGNANKSMFSVSAPLYALPTKTENGYGPADIMYFAFDYDKTYSYGISNSFECQNYSRFLKNLKKDEETEYFPLPPDPMANLKFSILDFKKQEAMDTLISVFKGGGVNVNTDDGEPEVEGEADKGKKIFNFVYVSYGTDIENIDTANKILEKWDREEKKDPKYKLRVFVKVRSNLITEENKDNDKIIYYGNYAKAYSRDSIIREKIFETAKNINAYYCKESLVNANMLWKKCLPGDKDSSIASAQSYRIVLNMLGLDLVDSKEYYQNLKEQAKKLKSKIKKKNVTLDNLKKQKNELKSKIGKEKDKDNLDGLKKIAQRLEKEIGDVEKTISELKLKLTSVQDNKKEYDSLLLKRKFNVVQNNKKLYYQALKIEKEWKNLIELTKKDLKKIFGFSEDDFETLFEFSQKDNGTSYNPENFDEYYTLSDTRKSIIKALNYYEHQRWNAFEILSGFIPMKKELVAVKVVKKENALPKISLKFKDKDIRIHCALTTYNGLKELSDYMAGKAKEYFETDEWKSMQLELTDEQKEKGITTETIKTEFEKNYSVNGKEVDQYHKDGENILLIPWFASMVKKIITGKDGRVKDGKKANNI